MNGIVSASCSAGAGGLTLTAFLCSDAAAQITGALCRPTADGLRNS